MPVLIRSEADLHALARPQSLLHPFRKPPALLGLSQLSPDENAAWGQRLEQLRLRCGCTASMIGLGLFTLASLAYVLCAALRTHGAATPDYRSILLNCAFFCIGLIASALLGKFAGLAFAALRFRQTCRMLQNRLRQLPA